MRLLVRVAAAISSMRAPLSPLLANSTVATSKMPVMVRAGSLVRLGVRAADVPVLRLASAASRFIAKCTGSFISSV